MKRAAIYLRAFDYLTRFRLTLVTLATVVVALGLLAQVVHANVSPDPSQSTTALSVRDDERIVRLEAAQESLKEKVQGLDELKDRMTRLEAAQESNKWLLMTIAGGVILMCIEALARMLKIKGK